MNSEIIHSCSRIQFPALEMRAALYEQLGQTLEALKDFDAIPDASIYVVRAAAYLKSGKRELAVALTLNQ